MARSAPWLLIVTGGSRGLGAALVARARQSGHRVLALSRTAGEHDDDRVLDLARPETIAPALVPELRAAAEHGFGRFVLINNAAVLDPIGACSDPGAISRHMAVNLVAPIVASRLFIETLARTAADKRIVLISSGAATRAIAGWSLYGAAKAGLDQFGRVLAEEQQACDWPVDVVSISPGVIDTDMQAGIRAASERDFPQVERFRELHRSGALRDPDAVAAAVLAGLARAERFQGQVVDLARFVG